MPRINNCCRNTRTADSVTSGAGQTEFVEDMPMCRYINPIPICTCEQENGGSCQGDLDQILSALACQNQLLIDLLGAVNALTAAVLASGSV